MRFSSFGLRKVGPFSEIRVDLPEKSNPNEAEVHIFTGTNGTGKSTLLRCFAGLVEQSYQPLLKRIRPLQPSDFSGPNNAFSFFDCQHDWLGQQELYRRQENPNHIFSALNFGGPSQQSLTKFHNPYHQDYRSLLNIGAIEFAAFGYAGGRTLNSANLSAISEISSGPLQNAMSFDQTVNAATMVQWIANVKTKEAMAFRKGQMDRVERHAKSISRIESAISEIIDSPVTFEFEDEPSLEVKVKVKGNSIEFDVLPDGLKSILSWLADLLMRLDRIPWANKEIDLLSQTFALFLDEVDVHLHPTWQRKVLKVAKKIFPNAQIFVATHSPFVVSSIEGGWIHRLQMQSNGSSTVISPVPSRAGYSYDFIMDDIFGIEGRFDEDTEHDLTLLKNEKQSALSGDKDALAKFHVIANKLRTKSPELAEIVELEVRQMNRLLTKHQ